MHDARRRAARAAMQKEKLFILRWKRILADDYVESSEGVPMKEDSIEVKFEFGCSADSHGNIGTNPSRVTTHQLSRFSDARGS